MFRNQLIPYLSALFSSGNPSPRDFEELIKGLGSQSDRPHISCVSDSVNIPDNQLVKVTYAMPAVSGGSGSSGGCGCGCRNIPVPVSRTSGGSSQTRSEKVINILCDYFKEGWEIDCVGLCTGTLAARAYYFVVSMDSANNTYEIMSVQFNNPGFDSNGVLSSTCVRMLRMRYNRTSQCITEVDSHLLLSDRTPVVQSCEVRAIKIVYDEPPKVEDGVLYIQFNLVPLRKPDLEVTALSQSSVTLSWSPVEGAVHYEFRMSDQDEPVVVDGTTYTIGGLSPDMVYTMSVKAVADGVTRSNSSWSHIVVETKCSMILQTPAVRIISTVAATGVVAEWEPVEEATSYSYQIGCGCTNSLVTGVTDTRISIDGLDPDRQYTLRVKAVSVEESVLDSDWAAIGFKTK